MTSRANSHSHTFDMAFLTEKGLDVFRDTDKGDGALASSVPRSLSEHTLGVGADSTQPQVARGEAKHGLCANQKLALYLVPSQ